VVLIGTNADPVSAQAMTTTISEHSIQLHVLFFSQRVVLLRYMFMLT
jgi:hypothetical protein